MAMVPALQFDNWQWLSLLMATPVVLWGGWPFHRAAWANLRHATATMDTLISIGTLSAWAWSLYALFLGDAGANDMRMELELIPSSGAGANDIYLETAAIVTTFILAGRYFEARAKRRAGAAVRALLELGAKDVALLGADGAERRVPVEQLVPGDRFVVRPGEKVATDGIVEDGHAAVDLAMLTGESVPVEVGPGSEVAGATVNVGGRLVVRATKVGADTALAQIARLVGEAQSGKAPVQRLADRISGVFVPVVLVIAAATLLLLARRGAERDVRLHRRGGRAHHRLPVRAGPGHADRADGRDGPRRAARAAHQGPGGARVHAPDRHDRARQDGHRHDGQDEPGRGGGRRGRRRGRGPAAGGRARAASEHPIARAVAAAAEREHGPLPAVERFASRAGLGVEGIVEGRAVVAGRPALLAERSMPLPPELEAARAAAAARGRTAVAVGWDGAATALLVVADTVKPGSAEAVARLRALGLRPVLLTGDAAATAEAVAAEVGIDEVVAEVMPAEKAAVIRRLQAEGRVVAMAGDGVNDAPALAQADLGLAIGTGTDVAIEASDLTLVSGDLRAAAQAIRLSRATLRTIKQNLGWAFAYNVAAIPLAAVGLLNPVIASAAMALSSVSVVANALRLRRFGA